MVCKENKGRSENALKRGVGDAAERKSRWTRPRLAGSSRSTGIIMSHMHVETAIFTDQMRNMLN